jgi:uncharacterized protein (TIGR02646 family)
MRQISGPAIPNILTEWREGTPGVGYGNMPAAVRDHVKGSLIDEQRCLCAYTGLRITMLTSHIEHLLPQDYCSNGEDLVYNNMVACYPSPGAFAPFGAVKKRNWPSPSEQYLFVSPRSSSCESRFTFTLNGKITAAKANDNAARETIRRLALDHKALDRYRKEAIGATLEKRGHGPASLRLTDARRRLDGLVQAEASAATFEPFCFVLKQALQKHIRRLEAIVAQKRSPKSS